MTPFCDYLSVSTPHVDKREPFPSMAAVLGAGGFRVEGADARSIQHRSPGGGLITIRRVGSVTVASASGVALADLRAAGEFDGYLWQFADVPCRVTRLDATLDLAVHAPSVLREIAARARRGELRVTDRAIQPGDVTEYSGSNDAGELTGTVYLAPATAEIRPVLYDKRHERLTRGCADPGDLLRIELRFRSKVRLSLRDAADPAPLFFHYASPGLVRAPPGVARWAPPPDGCVGFTLPRPVALDPLVMLERRCDRSADLFALAQLAASIPGGLAYLHRRLDRLAGVGSPADAIGSPPVAAERATAGTESVPDVRPLH